MIRPAKSESGTDRPNRVVRRSIIALLVTGILAFAIVATASLVVARRIAREEVLAEAIRSARTVSSVVFLPMLPRAINGEIEAIEYLDNAVAARVRDGIVVRIKIWRRDGTIVYSNDRSLIGRVFPVSKDLRVATEERRSVADLSELDDPENVNEGGLFDRLVEVYVPLTLDDGNEVVFEVYSTDARLTEAESRLTSQLEPFALAALLVLVLLQLPVAMWLVRRVGHAQQERNLLLARSLAASARERRAVARDLHDGAVQDLAGVGYALGAIERALPAETSSDTRSLLARTDAAVLNSVQSLRTLMIEIHPPDLTAGHLDEALSELGTRIFAESPTTVDLRMDPVPELGADTIALIYRATRECLGNVAKHAHARHVLVELIVTPAEIQLRVTDDGSGLPPGPLGRSADGHLGLRLLADAAHDLGGTMTIGPTEPRGATAILTIPLRGAEDAAPPGSRRWLRRRSPTNRLYDPFRGSAGGTFGK
jgi:signal transduction histidine kinase